MREAVYGWMALHLKGEGDGAPVAEPEIETEDPEALRCYPGESRPDDWVTLPRFAAAEGRKLLAARPGPKDAAGRRRPSDGLRTALVEKVFGGFPEPSRSRRGSSLSRVSAARLIHFQPEPGVDLTARVEAGHGPDAPLVVLIDLDGAEAAGSGPWPRRSAGPAGGWRRSTSGRRASWPGPPTRSASPRPQLGRVGALDRPAAAGAVGLRRPRLLDALERPTGAADPVVLIGRARAAWWRSRAGGG